MPEIKERKLQIPFDTGKIISVIGVRRSGKTYILYDTIKKLLDKGIEKEKILYLNFEDERLLLNRDTFDMILQAYQEIYPEINFQDIYMFFDEVQNIEYWEKFIRRVYDTKCKNIFISGSNSKLLSSEIATELRGRAITYKIYPLNFEEYLTFKNVNKSYKTLKEKSNILYNLEKYLAEGSFPEVLFVDKRVRMKILQEYFNVMIFRDIIDRYRVSSPMILKIFIKKIFSSVTKTFSVNKVYNDLKSMGYKISNSYLYEYMDYSEAVFLTISIDKYDFSEIKQIKSEKKVYIIDNGLLANIEFSVSSNKGKLLENAVCLELIKSGKKVYYFKDKYECDFIVEENKDCYPVQVAYEMNDEETRKREYRGLFEACKYLGQSKGTIITFDYEEIIQYKGIIIDIIPFYRYF